MATTAIPIRLLVPVALALACWLPAQTADAQTAGGPFGLGIILGEPSGVTGKLFLGGDESAVDLHLAWDFTSDAFGIYADYLFHFQPWDSPSDKFDLPMYAGVGAGIIFHDDVRFGVRVPVGVSMLFQRAPVEVFLELVPGLRLIPKTRFDFGGGVGARYYF